MSRFLRNENGMTLVEMLATISIASMIILMITSAHLFIQNQYNKQSEQISQLNDMTYVMKLITHDFRRAEPQSINVDENDEHLITIGDNHYIWDESEEVIKKNEMIIVNHISGFSVMDNNNEIHIYIQHAYEKEKNLILTRREEE